MRATLLLSPPDLQAGKYQSSAESPVITVIIYLYLPIQLYEYFSIEEVKHKLVVAVWHWIHGQQWLNSLLSSAALTGESADVSAFIKPLR